MDNAISILNEAVLSMRVGNISLAKEKCGAAATADSTLSEAGLLLGTISLFEGDLSRAEELLWASMENPTVYFAPVETYVDLLCKTLNLLGKYEQQQFVAKRLFPTGDKLFIKYLEMDVSYACNLACKGCTHYSNYGLRGGVDFAIGSVWIKQWGERIYPERFRILGGEPTLNRELYKYIELAAKVWERSSRGLVSNGLFICRQIDLLSVLAQTNTKLTISIHNDAPDILRKIDVPAIKELCQKLGVNVVIDDAFASDFDKYYIGEGHSMMPFSDNNPEVSASVCRSSLGATIHLGRIWKCSQIAFLNNIDERFSLYKNPKWQPYLQHKGLGFHSSDYEIWNYLRTHEYFCGMCPTKRMRALDI